MKRSIFLLLTVLLYTTLTRGQSAPDGRIIDERYRAESIEQIIEIDDVWAGHPVGFALLTHGDRQYIAYYNADRQMTVGQRDLDQDEFELYTLPPKERESRDGTSTILGWDSHNYVTLAVDEAGYIHLSGNMHVNGLTYFRSTEPDDITTLIQVEEMTGSEEDRCTYPKFMKTTDGELIFRYRDGGSGDGNDIYNVYDTKTKEWTRLVDTPMTDGQGLMNAYASQPRLMADGWYHLYWVWRDTPDCSTNHDLSYMKSPDMRRWFDVYGNPIELPATLDKTSLIVDPIPVKGGIINLAAKLCLDQNNMPIFAYHKYDDAGNLQFYTARFNGHDWKIKQVTEWGYRWEFSGNGSINSEVRVGDFVRRSDGFFELGYTHIKYGTGTMLLNEDLELVGKVLKPAPFRERLQVEGDFPGLQVQTAGDLGESREPGARYLLKWETLNRNRDRPRPRPWPEPSRLYLYKLQQPAKNWKALHTAEDLYQAYPARTRELFDQFNLEYPGLEKVKAALEQNKIPLACDELLRYYRKEGAKPYVDPTLPPASTRIDPEAEPLRSDTYTFYRQTDQVPRDAEGKLDWTHQGPADDIEWAWGLNRHPHIRTLMVAYLKTGNPAYAKRLDQDIRDWIIQSLPYPGVKSSTAMWRGLEVSFRVKVWAQAFHRLMKSDHLSPATRLFILTSIPEHAHYLRKFHAQGNWLTMEMSGLATVAATWPELKKSPAWMNYAKETMLESLKEQVYPDGVQTELTAHYHYVALNNFNQFLEICRLAEEPLPAEYTQAIEKMWNYLAYTMRPDGRNILNNDSDLRNYKELVTAASEDYQREDWRYIASNGREGARPNAPPAIFFPWAGQFITRNGYQTNDHWAFFDIGPWGSGHQHNDKLHLSITAYDRDFLVDGGRFAYRGEFAEKFRPYARGSQSHNVLLIDGQGQGPGPREASEPLGDKHFRITEAFDYAWGSFDQFNDLEGRQAKHTRALFYLRDQFWIVVDRIETDRPRQIEALWHWHPDCTVSRGSKAILYTDHKKGNLSLVPVGKTDWQIRQVKGQEEPEPQGWYSPEYNEAEPNLTSIYSTDVEENATFIWVLYPSENAAPKVKAKVLSEDSNGVRIRVKTPEGKYQFYVPYADSSNVSLR